VDVAAVGAVGRAAGIAFTIVDLAARVAAGAARDNQACINNPGGVDAGSKAAVLGSGYIQVRDNGVSAAMATRAAA
jgi:hypothetical protein